MHGKGTLFARYNDAIIPDFQYEGMFFKNMMHGFGTMTELKTEDRYEGEFIKSLKNGKGTIYKKDG